MTSNLENLIGKTIKVKSWSNYHRWIKIDEVDEEGKNGRATIGGQLVKSTDPNDDIDKYNQDGDGGVWAYTEQIVDNNI